MSLARRQSHARGRPSLRACSRGGLDGRAVLESRHARRARLAPAGLDSRHGWPAIMTRIKPRVLRPWSYRSGRQPAAPYPGRRTGEMNYPPTGALLSRVVRVVTIRPAVTIVVGLALALAGVLFAGHALTFQSSSVQLLPPHHLYVQRFKEHLHDFGDLNDIVVVIEAPSVPRAQAYADRLATEIKRLPSAGRVAYRIDPELFAGQALLYLKTEQLADLGLDGGPAARLDPGFVDTLLGVVADGLDGTNADVSPWTRVFTSAADQTRSGYFFSADDRLLFVLVEPRRDATSFTDNKDFIAAIRRIIRSLRETYPDVAAGATGTPALSNDEMLTAFHDSTVATLLAIAVTVGLLFLVIRRTIEPILMLAALLVSLAWSLGVITAVVGHLSVFSVMFMSLLVGL